LKTHLKIAECLVSLPPYKNFSSSSSAILNEHVGKLPVAHTITSKTADRPLSRLSPVDMADDGSSLFCDDDETCEKNVSESEDDGETYVSAPIG